MSTAKTTVEPLSEDCADGFDSADEARAAVHVGLWVSATRCVLTYVVAPAAGVFGIFLGPIGLVLQTLGAVTAAAGVWRLWTLKHRARYAYLALTVAVDLLALLTLLQIAKDFNG